MTALLDTHALVWMAAAPERLSSAARAIVDRRDALIASTVIAFEYEDPRRRGRLPDAVGFADGAAAFDLDLAPAPADLWRMAASLPNMHGDPVDRMLLAHGAYARVPVVTADRKMREYPVPAIW